MYHRDHELRNNTQIHRRVQRGEGGQGAGETPGKSQVAAPGILRNPGTDSFEKQLDSSIASRWRPVRTTFMKYVGD